MKPLSVIVALLISSAWVFAEALPPENARAEWKELEKLRFHDWGIKAFKGWDVPFDGGSKVFFFESSGGKRFDVMAANPAYWTDEDMRNRKQVFFVIHDKKFYRLEAGSDQEAKLIAMIEMARPKITGKGNNDPKLLDSLVKRIRSRKPMFKAKAVANKPATAGKSQSSAPNPKSE